MTTSYKIDPKLDLVLERIIDVSPELVWKAWTQPELIKKWFTPAPWKTVDCKIELRPGGTFLTTMQSPEGHSFPNQGCYLEVVENKRLVWTSALQPGFRPTPKPENGAGGILFTGMILLEPHAKGTKYTAVAMHSVPEDRTAHESMGFQEGWSKALDQLIETVKKI